MGPYLHIANKNLYHDHDQVYKKLDQSEVVNTCLQKFDQSEVVNTWTKEVFWAHLGHYWVWAMAYLHRQTIFVFEVLFGIIYKKHQVFFNFFFN